MRVLPASRIPDSLWFARSLTLPAAAIRCYKGELSALGLLNAAQVGTDKKAIHGGPTHQQTIEHFTYRFVVSAGRPEFVAISPYSELEAISDALIGSFSDDHIALLDIPCGSGALTVALLTTIAALRAARSIPRLPLTVTVLGGDISQHALDLFSSLLDGLRSPLKRQGILINYETAVWDASRGDSTAHLLDHWFQLGADAKEHVVCISNFSGVLTESASFEAFSPNLEQILGRLHDKRSTLLWIEPISRKVRAKFLPRLLSFFTERVPWFITEAKESAFISSQYNMQDPISGQLFSSGVEVQKFVRS